MICPKCGENNEAIYNEITQLLEDNTVDGLVDYDGFAEDVIGWLNDYCV